ncbi:unnamed protein product [Rotaria sp. Silwood1]|nr:unnamed protein product [Rotaria sp. Silwood1]CAF1244604.1 unnamed protein product [Rotaria sp. Silwood1]CAF3469221.1 unnamed protein product [Rotaria sp. Silwood1]CAF4676182.1 unnamed protein product [Rotaria sp. Silwood1]CAF4749733.1 unnamed protein product [Rotaria sp. Silwood1]
MCSSIFIAGHSEQQQRTEDLDMFPMKYATFTVNNTDLSVSASLFGFAQRKAIYRHGLGATLISELTEDQIHAQTFNISIPPDINQDNIPWPMGTECYYNSGNTNILSRIIRHTVGESEYHSFPYQKLFYKLGMNSFIMEVDASGTFVGSSYSWGTARDWSRFGLLYLNNGLYNNERILSENWIKQTTTLAGSNQYGEYGFHFWLNTGKTNDSTTRRFPNVPTDMFYASGFDGQSIFIIPSKKLVVVRLGLTKSLDGEYGANEFLKNIISSIQ